MALRLFGVLMVVTGLLASALILTTVRGSGWLFLVFALGGCLFAAILFALANIVEYLERIAKAVEDMPDMPDPPSVSLSGRAANSPRRTVLKSIDRS